MSLSPGLLGLSTKEGAAVLPLGALLGPGQLSSALWASECRALDTWTWSSGCRRAFGGPCVWDAHLGQGRR